MKESNQLIEEFMLLANRKVAAFIGDEEKHKKPKTFVYRIHDLPNMEKLESFALFIRKFGHRMLLTSGKNIQDSLNKVLKTVKGTKEQNLIETLAVRSMAKAEYSTENIGHYGLSFKYYSHFTSPIRRYPDMMYIAYWHTI
jgi:ribonuclease R